MAEQLLISTKNLDKNNQWSAVWPTSGHARGSGAATGPSGAETQMARAANCPEGRAMFS